MFISICERPALDNVKNAKWISQENTFRKLIILLIIIFSSFQKKDSPPFFTSNKSLCMIDFFCCWILTYFLVWKRWCVNISCFRSLLLKHFTKLFTQIKYHSLLLYVCVILCFSLQSIIAFSCRYLISLKLNILSILHFKTECTKIMWTYLHVH